jgi:DNA-binding response OmpR family regulator
MGTSQPHGLVFVVDDDDSIRGSLAEILENEGYDVHVAKNGADALARMRALDRSPCVILLDLMMPLMDGFEFRALQLADERIAGVPVVVFSADGATDRKAASLNVAASLKKPVRLEDVLQAIEAHCGCSAGER